MPECTRRRMGAGDNWNQHLSTYKIRTMSDRLFKKVDYTMSNLMADIEMGKIGLPDIQRPFVWKNSKIRDLFDSLYRGYPVGYFLFWQNAYDGSQKQIGSESKQKAPNLLIVDG